MSLFLPKAPYVHVSPSSLTLSIWQQTHNGSHNAHTKTTYPSSLLDEGIHELVVWLVGPIQLVTTVCIRSTLLHWSHKTQWYYSAGTSPIHLSIHILFYPSIQVQKLSWPPDEGKGALCTKTAVSTIWGECPLRLGWFTFITKKFKHRTLDITIYLSILHSPGL